MVGKRSAVAQVGSGSGKKAGAGGFRAQGEGKRSWWWWGVYEEGGRCLIGEIWACYLIRK